MSARPVSRWFARALWGALFALLIGLVGISFARPAAADDPTGPVVSIKGFAFDSAMLTVPVGTTVTWMNNDTTEHSTTSDTDVWDSMKIVPGASFSTTFTTPGTYTYHCKYHVFMKATVIVMDPTTSAPPATDASTPAAGG